MHCCTRRPSCWGLIHAWLTSPPAKLALQGLAGRPILYRGTVDCLRQVLRAEGLGGFYAASLPSYLKVAPSLGMMYFLYEAIMAAMPPAAAAAPAAPAVSAPAAAAAEAE